MKKLLASLLFFFLIHGIISQEDTVSLNRILFRFDSITTLAPEKAIALGKQSELIFNDHAPVKFRIKYHSRMGKTFARLSEVQQATLELDKVLSLVSGNPEYDFYNGETYNSYSILYSKIGDFNKAINYLLKAIHSYEKHNYTANTWELKQNLAICYAQTGNLDKALDYFRQAETVLKTLKGFENTLGNTYTNIGVVFNMKNLPDSALKYYNMAYDLTLKDGNSPGLAMLLNNMADVMFRIGKKQEGVSYLEKALEMMRSTGDKKGIIMALNNLSDVMTESGKLNDALRYVQEAYDLASGGKLFHDLKSACDHLSVIYFKMNDTKKAYQFCRRYATLNDSLLNSESIKQIAEMETKYETAGKQKEIEILKRDNDLQQLQNSKNRTVIICLISGFVVLAMMLFLIFRQYKEKKKVNKQLAHKNEIIEEKQKEILDSIKYARRIQSALITSEKYIYKNLNKLHKN
jgi:tetratricopeptide (TPR) repeat protein